MIKLHKSGAIHITRRTCQLPNGPAHELAFENDRWVQRNITTGYEVKLALPWEVDQSIRANHKFCPGMRGLWWAFARWYGTRKESGA